jgi:hypothetical protein
MVLPLSPCSFAVRRLLSAAVLPLFMVLLLAAPGASGLSAQPPLRLDQAPAVSGERTSTGAARNQEFLRRIYHPLDMPAPEQQRRWVREHHALKASEAPQPQTALEPQGRSGRSTTAWLPDGPNGVKLVGQSTFFSGRIRDIGLTDDGRVRIGAASGGLWEQLADDSWVPLSDSVTSQAIGTFHSPPGNDRVILLGTGEASQRSGTGVWRSEDGGLHWTPLDLSPQPSSCRTLRFAEGDTGMAHLAGAQGYYRSEDGGRTFTRMREGEMDDVQIHPTNPQRVYLSQRNSGLYRSDMGGDSSSFVKLNGPWDSTNYGRGVLAICALDPDVLYFNLIRLDDWRTEGVYRSTDGGDSWVKCFIREPDNSLVDDFHWGQGWYNTSVSVKPNDCSYAHVGGGSLWRSIDSVNFKEIDPVHVDQHRLLWAPDGSYLWSANDGGLFRSEDGWFFEGHSGINALPIRQYSSFSVGLTDPEVMAGGSQDNGIAVRSPTAAGWRFTIGGDGGAVSISRYDHTLIFATNGVYGGDLSFRNLVSFSEGTFWDDRNDGMQPCGQWWRNMRDDDAGGVYTHGCGDVYYSEDLGGSWEQINDGASWFTSDLWNLTVSRGEPANVYACLRSGATRRLQVLDRSTGNWIDRSSGLPSDTYVRTVVPDPVRPDRAWAVMGGVPASGDLGRKVYRTDDAGQNWINATGNLPNVPLTDAVVHPWDSATVVLCGDVGCFITEDEGLSWTDFSEGLPVQLLFTELGTVDSSTVNGRWWIYGATYGRAVWKRAMQGEIVDVPSGTNGPNASTIGLELYPNPAQGHTVLRMAHALPSTATVRLYDINGRMRSTQYWPAAQPSMQLSLEGLTPGIYTVEVLLPNGVARSTLMVR